MKRWRLVLALLAMSAASLAGFVGLMMTKPPAFPISTVYFEVGVGRWLMGAARLALALLFLALAAGACYFAFGRPPAPRPEPPRECGAQDFPPPAPRQ
jgi:hypothetical protein